MKHPNINYAAMAVLIEGLARNGLRHVCISPGSRNTPLAFSFAENTGVTNWIHHDERSAAFFGLGLAKATGTPVALVCTSGTAAAEYLPAVVEARLSRTPLLILTADRPPELREIGAPQTIYQPDMFGRAVVWSIDAPPPSEEIDSVGYFATLAARAWRQALGVPTGPVHINLPFREPLVPVGEQTTYPDPIHPTVEIGQLQMSSLESALAAITGRRGIIVAGASQDLNPAVISEFAQAAGWPILADPLSGLRTGGHGSVVTIGDWLARRGDLGASLRPEVIVRVGAPVTSRAINTWMVGDVPQVLIDSGGWPDPGGSLHLMLAADPAATLSALAAAIQPQAASWLDAWQEAERAIRASLTIPFPSEPGVVDALAENLPANSILYVGSSMPIRDVDAFFPTIDRPITILGNRGANGIDGLISSALGAAATGRATFVVTGDLSLIHDLSALGVATRLRLPLTIVLVNNDGGGIFHFLAQRNHPEHFESHIAAPHGHDFASITEAFGVRYRNIVDRAELAEQLSSSTDQARLFEVRTDRQENLKVHQDLWDQVQAVKLG